MGLFSSNTCCHCGQKAGAVFGKKLADGTYLCADCYDVYNDDFLIKASNIFANHDSYQRFLVHLEENKRKLQQFDFSLCYYSCIYYDAGHDWFLFDPRKTGDPTRLINDNREVFEGKDLIYYDFYYDGKRDDSGIISKAYIDTTLTVAFNNEWYPLAFSKKIVKNAKHNIYDGLFTSTMVAKGSRSLAIDAANMELTELLFIRLYQNGILYPLDLSGRFSTNVDLTPYSTYFQAMWFLQAKGALTSSEVYLKLEQMTPNDIIKHKIKKQFFRA